jgi:hypothetical protein
LAGRLSVVLASKFVASDIGIMLSRGTARLPRMSANAIIFLTWEWLCLRPGFIKKRDLLKQKGTHTALIPQQKHGLYSLGVLFLHGRELVATQLLE